jgi:hypothetical protein
MNVLYFLLSGLTFGSMPLQDFPQAEIRNSLINAKLYLPDADKGYYQATRFDWSGNMFSLEYNGHTYFGQWFKNYDPKVHESVMGPTEEFTALNYDNVKPGANFVKIGVGVLQKPDNKPFNFARLYPIMNYGTWKVKKQSDQILFTHELKDPICTYVYEKTISLTKDKPELVIAHKLRNKGTEVIETSVYDHNFFVIDKQQISQDVSIKVPFTIKAETSDLKDIAEFKGKEIRFLREVADGESVFCGTVEGFGPGKEDYDFSIENSKTGAGVRITCDQPLLKLAFWSCSKTACPEPYIKIRVEPGQEFSWTIRYNFYTLDK